MHALSTINKLNTAVSQGQELLGSHVEVYTQSGNWVSGVVVDAFIGSRSRDSYVRIKPDHPTHSVIAGEWFTTWRPA